MSHDGGCLCGQVQFSIESEPVGARMCWCRDCQYIASGSATVNVLFDEKSVKYTGEFAKTSRIADSGNSVERGFCPSCGSQLYSRTVKPAGLPMRIRAGTLNNPELIAPTAIIWADKAPAWALLDPALIQHKKGPDSPLVIRS